MNAALFDREWIVGGTAPDALEHWDTVENGERLFATVNAGINVYPKSPDIYAIFELEAISRFGDDARQLLRAGTDVWTRDIRQGGVHPEAHTIRQDIDMASATDKDITRYIKGQNRCLIISGVTLIQVIIEKYRPKAIHLTGFSGYAPGNMYHIHAKDNFPDPSATWCKRRNRIARAYFTQMAGVHDNVWFIGYGDCNLTKGCGLRNVLTYNGHSVHVSADRNSAIVS